MLYIRHLRVKIELDTNKYDRKVDLERGEDESWDEFIRDVCPRFHRGVVPGFHGRGRVRPMEQASLQALAWTGFLMSCANAIACFAINFLSDHFGRTLTRIRKLILALVWLATSIAMCVAIAWKHEMVASYLLIASILTAVLLAFIRRSDKVVYVPGSFVETLKKLHEHRQRQKQPTTREIIGEALWARCEAYICDHRTMQLAERVQGDAVAPTRWVLSRFLFLGPLNQELEFWLRRSIMNANMPIDIKWCCTMIRYIKDIADVEVKYLPPAASINVYLNGLLSGLDFLTRTSPEQLTATDIAECRSMLAYLGTANHNYWAIKGNLDRVALERAA